MASELITVRAAAEGDLQRIRTIYNREVLLSTATYDTKPRLAAEQRAWFAMHGGKHPVYVAEQDGVVCAWASLSPWSDRAAYGRSVETSVYVDGEYRRRGIGQLLLQTLIDAGRTHGHHALLARISADNTASIELHARLGFFVAGTLKEVGVKFGTVLDVCIMELILPGS